MNLDRPITYRFVARYVLVTSIIAVAAVVALVCFLWMSHV